METAPVVETHNHSPPTALRLASTPEQRREERLLTLIQSKIDRPLMVRTTGSLLLILKAAARRYTNQPIERWFALYDMILEGEIKKLTELIGKLDDLMLDDEFFKLAGITKAQVRLVELDESAESSYGVIQEILRHIRSLATDYSQSQDNINYCRRLAKRAQNGGFVSVGHFASEFPPHLRNDDLRTAASQYESDCEADKRARQEAEAEAAKNEHLSQLVRGMSRNHS